MAVVRTKALHDHCIVMARKSFLLAWNTGHGKKIAHDFQRILHLYSGDGEIIGPHSWSNYVVALEPDGIKAVKAAIRYPYGDFKCADPHELVPTAEESMDILLLFDLDTIPDYSTILSRWLPVSKFCCISYPEPMNDEIIALIKTSAHELLAAEDFELNDARIRFLVLKHKSSPQSSTPS